METASLEIHLLSLFSSLASSHELGFMYRIYHT